MIGWVLLALGAAICLMNAYLSWMRYPLHRLRGRTPVEFRRASGVPLLGTGLVVVAWMGWLRLERNAIVSVASLALLLLDSGGPHWFVLSQLRRREQRPPSRGDTA